MSYDRIEDRTPRSVWTPVVIMLVVLALLIGALIWLSDDNTAQSPGQPAPTEAPLNPGAG